MNTDDIRNKFGGDYSASELSYRMGIDVRFADHIADRFKGRVVLETCTGGGFTTIALARKAAHVFSVEVDADRHREARRNAFLAGIENVTFIRADVFDVNIESLPRRIDAALVDPDWADTGAGHVYRFIDSTTRPPSDWLLDYVADYTENITLVQPPYIDEHEFDQLLPHELERLFMAGNKELYCLHFGNLARSHGGTEFRIPEGSNGKEVQIHRRFAESSAKVWQAWTDPDVIRLWFGSDPRGEVLDARVDLRLGGSFTVTFQNSDGSKFTCAGEYVEIEPGRKLVFTWYWKDRPGPVELVTVHLEDQDGGTAMAFRHSNIDPGTTHNYEPGWNSTFDKLETALRQGRKPPGRSG